MYKITPIKIDSVTIDPENGKRLNKDGKIFKSLTTFWKKCSKYDYNKQRSTRECIK